MQFEKNLVLLRKKKGLSQDELAFAIGVSRQTIYTWEAGLNYPNIVMVKKIADVLEVTTDDLLNGFEVNRLPKTLKDVNLTYVSKHDEEVLYKELPNWFVSLNGRPKWVKDRCVHCQACLRCNAVQYGKRTKGKLRYVNPVLKSCH